LNFLIYLFRKLDICLTAICRVLEQLKIKIFALRGCYTVEIGS